MVEDYSNILQRPIPTVSLRTIQLVRKSLRGLITPPPFTTKMDLTQYMCEHFLPCQHGKGGISRDGTEYSGRPGSPEGRGNWPWRYKLLLLHGTEGGIRKGEGEVFTY